MIIATGDIVSSKGRIKSIQDGRARYIEFAQAKVIDVGGGGITVNPLGKSAMVACRPEDLDLIETGLEETPASQQSAAEHAEAAKATVERETRAISEPEASIAVTGEVAEEEKPKNLKALREKKRVNKPEPAPKSEPRRRRR